MPFEAHGVPYGHSTNLVGVPAGLIASTAFNDYPVPLSIRGVRETSRALFVMLDQARDAAEAAEAFEKYLRAAFAIDAETQAGRASRRCTGTCECRGRQDAGSGRPLPRQLPATAGRLGLRCQRRGGRRAQGLGREPLRPAARPFTRRRCGASRSPAWVPTSKTRCPAAIHNNSIYRSSTCSTSSASGRAHGSAAGARHVTLYRGVNDFTEHEILARPDRHSALVSA